MSGQRFLYEAIPDIFPYRLMSEVERVLWGMHFDSIKEDKK